MSNTTNTGSDASSSDYQYWRSQHRPSDDGGVPREKIEVFYDAVCNRFGEEMGQRLNGLIWPEVPSKAKRVAGVVGGRLLPLFMAYKEARRTAKAAMDFVTTSKVECGELQVTVDGRRVTVISFDKELGRFDKGLGRNLSDRLKACQSSWEVKPLFVENHFVEMVFDDASDNGSLVEWEDGKKRCERKVSRADAFDHLVKFLCEVYVADVAKQMRIDQNRPSKKIGNKKLREFLDLARNLVSSLSVEALVDG